MQQWYQCPKCGAPVTFGVKFCGNCGVQLNWPTQQTQPPPVYQQPANYQQQVQLTPSYHQQQQYKCFWLPIIDAKLEVFPRHKSLLCINEYCNLAFFILPDVLISMALSKVIYDNSMSNIAIFQQIDNNRDESYLTPILLNENQLKAFNKLTDSYNKGKLNEKVGDRFWSKLINEIKENSSRHFNYPQILQQLERADVFGRPHLTQADDENITADGKIPVYIYTCRGNRLKFAPNKFMRLETLFLVTYDKKSADELLDLVSKLPHMGDWQKGGTLAGLVELLCRLEFELTLNSDELKPQLTEIILDPDKSNITLIPNPIVTPTDKGKEALNRVHAPNSGFSIYNWGEPDIIQIILYALRPFPKPISSITIMKDELGIHTLPTYLFDIYTSRLMGSLRADDNRQVVVLDEIPTDGIPEIELQAISRNIPNTWWQTDRIARKILWLSVQNLLSHQSIEGERKILSIIPVGDNAIQVSIAQTNTEEGAPYAFAVIIDEMQVNAIPIFQSNIFKRGKDGSITTRTGQFLKNYTITRKGERIIERPHEGGFITSQFTRPIYSAMLRNPHFNPSSLLKLGDFQIGY